MVGARNLGARRGAGFDASAHDTKHGRDAAALNAWHFRGFRETQPAPFGGQNSRRAVLCNESAIYISAILCRNAGIYVAEMWHARVIHNIRKPVFANYGTRDRDLKPIREAYFEGRRGEVERVVDPDISPQANRSPNFAVSSFREGWP